MTKAIHPLCDSLRGFKPFLLSSNPHTQSDCYYIKDKTHAGVVVVWGAGEKEFGLINVAQFCRLLVAHLQGKHCPEELQTAVLLAGLAADPDGCNEDYMATVLAQTGKIHAQAHAPVSLPIQHRGITPSGPGFAA